MNAVRVSETSCKLDPAGKKKSSYDDASEGSATARPNTNFHVNRNHHSQQTCVHSNALAICKRLATYRCSQKLQRLARNRKLRHGATTATSISARQCCSSRTHSNSNMAYFQTFHRPSSSSSCTVYISGFLYHSVFVNALPCACVGGFLHQSWFEGQRSPQSLQG